MKVWLKTNVTIDNMESKCNSEIVVQRLKVKREADAKDLILKALNLDNVERVEWLPDYWHGTIGPVGEEMLDVVLVVDVKDEES